MTDVRVGGGTVPASQPNIQYSEGIESSATQMEDGVSGQQRTTQMAQTEPKKAEINKEYAAVKKDEQKILGTLKQNQLNQKLAVGKAKVQEFPADAGNEKLGAIGVYRQTQDKDTITQFPNGVRVTRLDARDLNLKGVTSDSGQPIFQQDGRHIAYTIDPPPGGKVEVQKDGQIIVKDSSGEPVAFMDPEGQISTKTKLGDYQQNSDGRIRFTPNGDTNPQTLRKPGTVNPQDYENYGITTDGKTIRFPNGVEYKAKHMTIPDSIGKKAPFEHSPSSSRPQTQEMGVGHSGGVLYLEYGESSKDRTYEVLIHGGSLYVSPDGKISYK